MSRIRSGLLVGILALLVACAGSTGIVVEDRFDRVSDGAWGRSEEPWTWDYVSTAGEPFGLSVDGREAVARAPDGVNKGNLVTGPDSAEDVEASATFAVDRQPDDGGTLNHWHILLRVGGNRTYYSFMVVPEAEGPATVKILAAKDGEFADLAKGKAAFSVETGKTYRVTGRTVSRENEVALFLRTWPVGTAEPDEWAITAIDAGSDRLVRGRAGVRLSFYGGPATMTVDDFSLENID